MLQSKTWWKKSGLWGHIFFLCNILLDDDLKTSICSNFSSQFLLADHWYWGLWAVNMAAESVRTTIRATHYSLFTERHNWLTAWNGRDVMNFLTSHFLGTVCKSIGRRRKNSLAKFDSKSQREKFWRRERWMKRWGWKQRTSCEMRLKSGSIHWLITMVEVASTTFDLALILELMTPPLPVLHASTDQPLRQLAPQRPARLRLLCPLKNNI